MNAGLRDAASSIRPDTNVPEVSDASFLPLIWKI